MAKNKVELKQSITLKINDIEIELTYEQANSIYGKLHTFLGKPSFETPYLWPYTPPRRDKWPYYTFFTTEKTL